MDGLKQYVIERFEQIFVLTILVVTATLNYFIAQKLAFLNFYFLPVILGGYFLGRRMAVLGAVFCALMVATYAYLYPESFHHADGNVGLVTHIVVWAGFLILAGAVVGSLRELLGARIDEMEVMYRTLQMQQDDLAHANTSLKDYSENLEARVQERTVELEHSKQAIESMKAKVENALYATMDPAVVNLMIEGKLRDEKRNVSLLFADLVAFTTYSEKHPPEIVISELNRYLQDIEPIIHAYRGHIDKYMGDGIMCEFGAPVNYATHRTLAVVGALKMQEQMRRATYPWQMRVGIASGSAFTGLIGHKRKTYTAIGDVVNLASRLESNCSPGGILIDEETYRGVADFVEAHKKRQIVAGDTRGDAARELELEQLETRLAAAPDDGDLHYRIGQVHLALREAADALAHFESAVSLEPTNTAFKVAYAEAGLQVKEAERISVKGRRQRVAAYEVVGLRDPLRNRDKLPQRFIDVFGTAAAQIGIPDDVVLPVEALDESVGHAHVVAVLSYAIASVFNIPEPHKLNIMRAGFLANLGKEMIPPHILNRGDALDKGELEIIRQHPIESGRMLRKLGYENADMIAYVTHVRENYDGSGYPGRLKGDAIPVGARIVKVADAYDLLTSRRPFRDAWARQAALQEMRRDTERGHFDPRIVNALVKLLADPA